MDGAVFLPKKRVKKVAVVHRKDGGDTGFGVFSEPLDGAAGPPKYHPTPPGHSCCSGRNG